MGVIRKAFDDAIRFSVFRPYSGDVDGFVLVEITFRFSQKQTRIKCVYAKDCAFCKSESAPELRSDSSLGCRPQTSDICLQRFDLGYVVPAMDVAAGGKMSFRFWVRPPKGAKEIEFVVWTDHIIPPPPYTLVLDPPNWPRLHADSPCQVSS